MSQTFHFNIAITCPNCLPPIRNALADCEFKLTEKNISIDIPKKTIEITVDNDDLTREEISAKLIETIEDTGIACAEYIDNSRLIRKLIIKGVIGIVIGAGLIALMLSGVALPMVAMYAIVGVSSLLTIALGAESYIEAVKKLVKSRTMTMDTLFTVSSLAMIAVSIASLFVPWLPMMCEAGILIFGFRYLGKAIEESIKQKITTGLKFADRGAKKVFKQAKESEEWNEYDTDSINAGEIIRVKKGDTIPLDGTFEGEIIRVKKGDTIPLDGTCENNNNQTRIYKTIINGNEEPEAIKKGDAIYAGMIVPADVDFIQMRVTKTKEDSHLWRSDKESAKIVPTPIEKTANKIMQFFIPGVFAAAALSGIVIGFVSGISFAIQCAASVLVSACPCTFGLIAPLAMQMGTAKAKQHGVHFKDAEALESAHNIDIVVFDLNGTLTSGTPTVTGHQFFDADAPTDTWLSIIEEMESNSTHKIAQAIAAYANKTSSGKKAIALSKDDINTSNHSGITAYFQDDHYLLGNKQFLLDNHIDDIPDIQLSSDDAAQLIYFVKNGKVVGCIKVEDSLRKDARFVINELTMQGKEVHICTGADEESAKRYARKLGIDTKNVHANQVSIALPDNDRTKTKLIEQLQDNKTKRVAMIGDAGNDANAIKQSNFGIAVKSASGDTMTQQNAGAVIDNSTLLPVVTAFAAAKQTISSIKQNLIISLAYNMTMVLIAGGILIAIGFALNPAIGVALMAVQAAFILLNQYRIHCQKFEHIKRYEEQEKLRLQQEEVVSSTTLSLHNKGLTLNTNSATMTPLDPAPPYHPRAAELPHSPKQGAQLQASTSLQPEAPRIFRPA